MKKAGLYIHIPFCKSKCLYCDFVSASGKSPAEIEAYVDSVIISMDKYRKTVGEYLFPTVFFGGGTPSYIDSNHICRILKEARKCFRISENAEITLECNPESLTEEKVKDYLSAGVNRFSLGLQSSDNSLLKEIGRVHTYNDFLKALSILRSLNVTNINADIMLSLPSQTVKDAQKTVIELINLDVPHLSVYSLKLEENTPLYKTTAPADEVLSAAMFEATYNILTSKGYSRYEVSNFSKKGYECRHNINYWKRGEYLGLGTAAHSFLNEHRFDGAEYSEDVSQDAEFEYIMLNLRLSEGLDLESFRKLFNCDFLLKYQKQLKKYSGCFSLSSRNVFLNYRGFEIMNLILTDF